MFDPSEHINSLEMDAVAKFQDPIGSHGGSLRPRVLNDIYNSRGHKNSFSAMEKVLLDLQGYIKL